MQQQPPRARSGIEAEGTARRHLEDAGLTTVCSRYRAPTGEVDLIMREGDVLVFVEVRSRNDGDFMSPLETIDRRKIGRVIRTSRHYLQQQGLTDRIDCRFDIVAICGNGPAQEIEWIRNAFEA